MDFNTPPTAQPVTTLGPFLSLASRHRFRRHLHLHGGHADERDELLGGSPGQGGGHPGCQLQRGARPHGAALRRVLHQGPLTRRGEPGPPGLLPHFRHRLHRPSTRWALCSSACTDSLTLCPCRTALAGVFVFSAVSFLGRNTVIILHIGVGGGSGGSGGGQGGRGMRVGGSSANFS